MIYLISVEAYTGEDTIYTLFETSTDSIFRGNRAFITELIETHKMKIVNASIDRYGVSVKEWYRALYKSNNGMSSGTANYILLCIINENTFKVLTREGIVIYINKKRLEELVSENNVANCVIENGKFKFVGTYNSTRDIQFEQTISDQYKRYETMTALMGCRMSFDYIIEGKEVKLKKYTGIHTNAIVPKFVTSIMRQAFYNSNVSSITLEEGLKSIGCYAFMYCNLSQVTIPKTVRFIGTSAFYRNTGMTLIGRAYDIDEDKIIILGKRTRLVDII